MEIIGTFGCLNWCQVPLENEISISLKLFSRERRDVLLNLVVDDCADFFFFGKINLNHRKQITWFLKWSLPNHHNSKITLGHWATDLLNGFFRIVLLRLQLSILFLHLWLAHVFLPLNFTLWIQYPVSSQLLEQLDFVASSNYWVF